MALIYKVLISSISTFETPPLLNAGSLPEPCGYISRAYLPTVTGAQRPRRKSSQSIPAALSLLVRPSMPTVWMHGVCSRYLLRRRFSPPMLTDPLAAAPSSPGLCRWSARAAPEANVGSRTVKPHTQCIGVCCRVQACGVVCIAWSSPYYCTYANTETRSSTTIDLRRPPQTPVRTPGCLFVPGMAALLIALPWSPAGGLRMGADWLMGCLSLGDGLMCEEGSSEEGCPLVPGPAVPEPRHCRRRHPQARRRL
jgi:hypothetical protein